VLSLTCKNAESTEVHDRLYDTAFGNDILIAEAADVPLAAAHLLGVDVATTLGPRRMSELGRWPGDAKLLIRDLGFAGGPQAWRRNRERRRDLLTALTLGLKLSTESPP
jgi:hypothetical protein